jgi:hypothetical protein
MFVFPKEKPTFLKTKRWENATKVVVKVDVAIEVVKNRDRPTPATKSALNITRDPGPLGPSPPPCHPQVPSLRPLCPQSLPPAANPCSHFASPPSPWRSLRGRGGLYPHGGGVYGGGGVQIDAVRGGKGGQWMILGRLWSDFVSSLVPLWVPKVFKLLVT